MITDTQYLAQSTIFYEGGTFQWTCIHIHMQMNYYGYNESMYMYIIQLVLTLLQGKDILTDIQTHINIS